MVNCFAPLCKHEGKTCRLFRFPNSPARRAKWIHLIRRKDRSPKFTSRLCSCHFEDENKKVLPTKFAWNVKKRLTFTTPEKRRRPPRSLKKQGNVPENTTAELDNAATNASEASFPETADEGVAETSEVQPQREHHADADDDLQKKIESLQLQLDAANEEVRQLRESSVRRNAAHQAEIDFLKQENERLKEENSRSKSFSFRDICDDEKLVSHYTGLPSSSAFRALVSVLDGTNIQYYSGWRVTRLSISDQIFMTLIKLRRNLSHQDLAFRFKVSLTTITNTTLTWISALHYILFAAPNSPMSKVPSRRKNQTDLPQCFKEYENTRIVLDCTEMRAEIPTLMSARNSMYSPYKHFVTCKGLVGIAPNGTVTFVSQLYPGRTSDKDIVAHSKVLEILEPGDHIMADKGFLIASMLPPDVCLNIPPFKETPQFTSEQVKLTYGIARARIHVERAIQRIKLYCILDCIPHQYRRVCSKVFQLCAALSNFGRPLVTDDCHNVERT